MSDGAEKPDVFCFCRRSVMKISCTFHSGAPRTAPSKLMQWAPHYVGVKRGVRVDAGATPLVARSGAAMAADVHLAEQKDPMLVFCSSWKSAALPVNTEDGPCGQGRYRQAHLFGYFWNQKTTAVGSGLMRRFGGGEKAAENDSVVLWSGSSCRQTLKDWCNSTKFRCFYLCNDISRRPRGQDRLVE